MRSRVLALVALGGVVAAGGWLASDHRAGKVAEPMGNEVEREHRSATSSIAPPAPPVGSESAPVVEAEPKALPPEMVDARLPSPATVPGQTGNQRIRELPGANAQSVAPVVSQPPAPPAGAPAVSSEEAAIDVDKITMSLRDFRTVMGGNPVGTNEEITRSLNGGNPKQARLLPEGQAMNAAGEMVDRWGSPYFFHQLSKTQMEIRSAGPDRKMWTEDDTVGH